MATYLELRTQAEKLMAEAEDLRKKEIKAAIAEIKEKMVLYGLTLNDLRDSGASAPSRSQRKSMSPPKYRGPNGETWSGGRGRKPDWALAVIKEKGEEGLAAYLIKD